MLSSHRGWRGPAHAPASVLVSHHPSPWVGCHLAVPRPSGQSGLQQETDGIPKGFPWKWFNEGTINRDEDRVRGKQEGMARYPESGSVGSLFHSGTWKDLGEGTGVLPEPTQRWSTVTTWQGRERPRSASILISLFPPSHLLPVSPN